VRACFSFEKDATEGDNYLFLPPLLYSSAWLNSWRDFRANLRPISLLALGLILLTTVVAHVLIPGLPWAVSFVLGAIVSPTDVVAATSIAQRLGITAGS
jgi:monovalent cation/hydrogen antiporter